VNERGFLKLNYEQEGKYGLVSSRINPIKTY